MNIAKRLKVDAKNLKIYDKKMRILKEFYYNLKSKKITI
jgi:hypothetical protein